MEIVRKTKDYEIIKKRSGRYGVRDAKRKWVSGDEKVKILLAEKLIQAPAPKKKEPEPSPDAEAAEPAAEVAAEEAEAATEETASES